MEACEYYMQCNVVQITPTASQSVSRSLHATTLPYRVFRYPLCLMYETLLFDIALSLSLNSCLIAIQYIIRQPLPFVVREVQAPSVAVWF